MKWLSLGWLLTVCLALAGCDKPLPPAAQAAPAAPAVESGPTKAQPRLPTVKLLLGTNEMVTEIARSALEVQTGMMFRTNMPEMEGMIFVFPDSDYRAFWMKNTLVPLSCAYINREGLVMELHDMKPLDQTSIPSVSGEIQYVLEVNQGWFKRHHVTPGTLIQSEKGTLRDTFFPRR
jgi:uncharacterized membrane protein (UPF0127 family)